LPRWLSHGFPADQRARPIATRGIQQRPATSWTDCVELAEVAWWGIQHRGVDRYTNRAAVALTESVLSLGGGERLYLYDKRSS
jgi:hypothetical protein